MFEADFFELYMPLEKMNGIFGQSFHDHSFTMRTLMVKYVIMRPGAPNMIVEMTMTSLLEKMLIACQEPLREFVVDMSRVRGYEDEESCIFSMFDIQKYIIANRLPIRTDRRIYSDGRAHRPNTPYGRRGGYVQEDYTEKTTDRFHDIIDLSTEKEYIPVPAHMIEYTRGMIHLQEKFEKGLSVLRKMKVTEL
jgi:hypothetical protein